MSQLNVNEPCDPTRDAITGIIMGAFTSIVDRVGCDQGYHIKRTDSDVVIHIPSLDSRSLQFHITITLETADVSISVVKINRNQWDVNGEPYCSRKVNIVNYDDNLISNVSARLFELYAEYHADIGHPFPPELVHK